MRETYSHYEFEVFSEEQRTALGFDPNAPIKWVYKIFGSGCYPYDDGVIDSDEWFETENEARFAAIGHIGLLEDGEG